MFFDSHVHFDVSSDKDGNENISLVERAVKAGVDGLIAVGGSKEGNERAMSMARRFPDLIFPAVGYDRDQARELLSSDDEFESAVFNLKDLIIKNHLTDIKMVAIGETGLDFHYSPETACLQIKLFESQLKLAKELRLPVIVHSREAEKETVKELERHAEEWQGDGERIGVVHCFTGGKDFAEKILDAGFYLGFSGIVTFKNADDVRAVVKMVPDDRVLIETDTPYLAPVPYRGKKNEPAFVRHVAEVMAGIRGCSIESMAQITARNARRLFGLNRERVQ